MDIDISSMFSYFSQIGSNLNLILIILGIVVAIVLLLIIIILIKIKKVKRVNELQEQKPISAQLSGKVSVKSQNEIKEQITGRSEPAETNVNFLDYNQKVRELLAEGNLYLDRDDIANAKIVYAKIKNWYDPSDDSSQELYSKIFEFYNRIVNTGK